MSVNASQGADIEELLDTAAAAEFLGLSATTLQIWRSVGRYDLRFVKLGRAVRYRKSDLEAWLQSRTRTRTA